MGGVSDSEKLAYGLRSTGRFIKKRYWILLILAVAALLAVVGYYIFYHPQVCANFDCFKTSMESCKPASYVNEEPEATLRYTITGLSDGLCEVDIKLLQAKEGSLKID